MGKKYSNFLTVLLVIIIIAIVGGIGFMGYKYYKTYIDKNSAEDFVDTFGDSNTDGKKDNNNNTDDIQFDGVDQGDNGDTENSTNGKKKKYNGFDVAGTIEIPATNLNSNRIKLPTDPTKVIRINSLFRITVSIPYILFLVNW